MRRHHSKKKPRRTKTVSGRAETQRFMARGGKKGPAEGMPRRSFRGGEVKRFARSLA